jgi:hypothetical protein
LGSINNDEAFRELICKLISMNAIEIILKIGPGVKAHVYNSSYLRGGDG